MSRIPPLPEPAFLKTGEDTFDDDTAVKWAWFAHGYDTGMEPFFSADQLRERDRQIVELCAKVCEEWGAARTPEAGGNALRNCAAALRSLLESR